MEKRENMKELKYGDLAVTILDSNEALGKRAAQDFAVATQNALKNKSEISIILATGNSQLSFVNALYERSDIEWSKISVFHMDEYLGIDDKHSASFFRWMHERIELKLKPKAFYGIRGDVPAAEEIARYTELLQKNKPSICVMGIGENGHVAFNDPPADFSTKELIKIVELDDMTCRLQQVNEGHFASLEDMPLQALTLTVRALLDPETVLVLTPESRKAQAVKDSLEGPLTPTCPASILKTAPNAHLYLDQDSSALLAL
ncbi:MAG: glucosamine-6-phosphate deaminase [Actinobacteria bacterium]|nr:glucosamine-6-phosphate deaminase [Actinomycetota bacterium]MSX71786.1 glucosamine-6-phosphate deaminase [Actinomycetota bacterium]MSY69681.1 glucosamine-6-phosphate deaminase [Actinomycetota bacterium]MTA75862.1 glucosamine-6-phosphate deaminase [Actinomycetota bacterium]